MEIIREKSFSVSATSSYQIRNNDKERFFKGPVKVSLSPQGIVVDGELWGHSITVQGRDNSFCQVNGRKYRGAIIINKYENTLQAINKLPLEEYLYGIIKREVSPEWPLSTLCAQSIVARTYALRKLQQNDGIITSLAKDQVYGGVGAEDARGRIAVDLTRGQILTYHGKPINALYHASSGGYLTSSQHVWGKDYPCLKAKKDPFSIFSPYQNWTVKISKHKLEKLLQSVGFRLKEIGTLKVLEKDPSGRVKLLFISSKNEIRHIPGRKLRELIGPNILRSTLFEVEEKKDMFIFKGHGWGHGVGMSQWGAAKMGEMGYTTEEILKFYYPGANISITY